tara:strand:- start:2856 stop:4571 length:1716 start_codon:yes stop_codon:yes gene_type:complete
MFNPLIPKYLFNKFFPGLASYVTALKRYLRNSIPIFYPKVFSQLKNILPGTNVNDKNKRKSKILIYATRQDPLHITWDLIIGKACELRGQDVSLIACDGLIQEACNERWYPELKTSLCKQCFSFAKKFYALADFQIDWLTNYLSDEHKDQFIGKRTKIMQREKAKDILKNIPFEKYNDFKYRDFPIGDLVRPSVCHFTRNENIEMAGKHDFKVKEIYKNFLLNAIMMVDLVEKILNIKKPDIVFLINGLFMSEAIMIAWLKRKEIRYVVYESGIMPDTMSFLHNQPIDYRELDDWEVRKNKPLNKKEKQKLNEYINSRIVGTGQQQEYWKASKEGEKYIKSKLDLDSFESIACLFPNVLFDSALFDKDNFFSSSKDWIRSTISFFSEHPNLGLLIRIHPAEIRWPQVHRDSIKTWIDDNYGKDLPQNIKVINASDTISSYKLMEIADLGLVSTSTTGMEMALMGKTVIATGDIYYRGRNFTIDPQSKEEYILKLKEILIDKKIPKVDVKIVELFAYHMFFESSIGISSIDSNNLRTIPPNIELSSYDQLLPGVDPNLDKICDGIIYGKAFV